MDIKGHLEGNLHALLPKTNIFSNIIDGFDESVASKPVKLFKWLDQYFDISTFIPLKACGI